MKKFRLFLLLIIMIIPCVSKANSLSCPDMAYPDEEIICDLSVDSSKGVVGRYNFSNNFSYISMDMISGWKNYYMDSFGFALGNVSSDNSLEAKLKVKVDKNLKVNNEYVIGINNLVSNTSLNEVDSLEDITDAILVVSNDNYLSNLFIKDVKFDKKFDKNNLIYKSDTTLEEVVVSASLSDKDAKLSGNIGNIKLALGTNILIVKVKSVYGEEREYKIYVTRNEKVVEKEATSSDKKEDSLDKDNSVNTPSKKEEVVNLDSDSSLKGITISRGSIDFAKDKYLYEVLVDSSVSSILVEAEANSSKASVVIDYDTNLKFGKNDIVITVKAEDGTLSKYVIVVTRKSVILDDDNTIKSLKIKNYDLDFESSKYKYSINIKDEDSLDIDVILNSDKSTYKIVGNDKLKNNSKIEIIVTAENGDTKSYYINVFKKNNSILKMFIGIGVCICVFLIIFVIVKLIKKLIKYIKDNKE